MTEGGVERTLGILLAKVEGIERSIAAGDQHRAVVHKRVDDLVETLGDLTTKVEVIDRTVADSKVVTDEVKQWKQRGIGALFVTGIASAAISSTIVGLLVYWWDNIMRVLRAA